MKIDADLVRYLAHMARLSLREGEIPLYTEQLSEILDFMERLHAIDTTGVPETTHVLDLENVFRPDEVRPSSDREEVLANAPERKGDCFAVPRIL